MTDTSDRRLAAILFTDIVGSTERAAQLGDRAWTELPERHNAAVRSQVARFRGREVDTQGDGFLATFDGPGRAITAARAIGEALAPLDIEVRAGLHTGEIEILGDDIAGLAVHIGARVASLAGPGEVLVSRTTTSNVCWSLSTRAGSPLPLSLTLIVTEYVPLSLAVGVHSSRARP